MGLDVLAGEAREGEGEQRALLTSVDAKPSQPQSGAKMVAVHLSVTVISTGNSSQPNHPVGVVSLQLSFLVPPYPHPPLAKVHLNPNPSFSIALREHPYLTCDFSPLCLLLACPILLEFLASLHELPSYRVMSSKVARKIEANYRHSELRALCPAPRL